MLFTFFDVMTFYVETYLRQSFQNITTNHSMIMVVVIKGLKLFVKYPKQAMKLFIRGSKKVKMVR